MRAGDNQESARATIQAGNVGDTVLRETGEIKCLAVSYGYRSVAQDTSAAHHATFPVLPRAGSKCRIGGADAGSAAANVNLIQPREKRKAFNEMKPASPRINPPAKGAPVVRAHFRSCTIGKNWNATTQKQIYPPLLTDHRADTQYFFLAKRRFSHPTLSHHTTIVSTPRVFPGAAAFFMRFTYCGLVVSPASRAAPCFSPFNRYSS
jgi:hypothetical protein